MPDKMKIFLIIISTALLASACAERESTANYVKLETGFALGTTYNITLNMADTTGLRSSIDSLFEAVVASMSVYDHNSLLNRLNRNETDIPDEHIIYCIETAAAVSAICGEYDITLKPVIDAWGFNDGIPGQKPNLDSLMRFVGRDKISVADGRLVKTDPRVQIDLNSIAKGYAADLLARLVEDRGATDYIVEVGGEIVCKGMSAKGRMWRVGVDRPVEGNLPGEAFQTIIEPGDAAMATSGNYRRFYKDAQGNRVVHTVSGLTGSANPGDMLSATVIADRCIVADAWATMLMAAGAERAREILESHTEVSAYLIYLDADKSERVYTSPALERKLIK